MVIGAKPHTTNTYVLLVKQVQWCSPKREGSGFYPKGKCREGVTVLNGNLKYHMIRHLQIPATQVLKIASGQVGRRDGCLMAGSGFSWGGGAPGPGWSWAARRLASLCARLGAKACWVPQCCDSWLISPAPPTAPYLLGPNCGAVFLLR